MSDLILSLLKRWGARRPYFDIRGADGSLYMGRWWIFGGSGVDPRTGQPRDDRDDAARGWTRTRLDAWIGRYFAARLHWIAREDRARDFHNHPCSFVSIVIKGWYIERLPLRQDQPAAHDRRYYRDVLRGPWSIAFRRAEDRHTIVHVSPGGAWTIFAMGRKRGSWGFFTRRGFVNWRSYEVQP